MVACVTILLEWGISCTGDWKFVNEIHFVPVAQFWRFSLQWFAHQTRAMPWPPNRPPPVPYSVPCRHSAGRLATLTHVPPSAPKVAPNPEIRLPAWRLSIINSKVGPSTPLGRQCLSVSVFWCVLWWTYGGGGGGERKKATTHVHVIFNRFRLILVIVVSNAYGVV